MFGLVGLELLCLLPRVVLGHGVRDLEDFAAVQSMCTGGVALWFLFLFRPRQRLVVVALLAAILTFVIYWFCVIEPRFSS